MGYAVIMFVILLLMAVTIALSANYGISKDSQEAPLLAENAYADREGGKAQTDFVVNTTKVNGTMKYTSADGGSESDPLNLYLTVNNTGSTNINTLKYSIILGGTWVWINSASSNITYPLENSTTASLNLFQRPLNLTLTSENGVKLYAPSAPKITKLDMTQGSDQCWRNVTIEWSNSSWIKWHINYYKLYYTYSDNINKNDIDIAIITGNNYVMGDIFRTKAGGQCGNQTGANSIYVWVSAVDVRGNEGVPSNTCKKESLGTSKGENCP